jgi:hypothetical protein
MTMSLHLGSDGWRAVISNELAFDIALDYHPAVQELVPVPC